MNHSNLKKAKLANKPSDQYSTLKDGDVFLVGPTRLNKGTHYYIYTLEGDYKGCLPIEWFEIIEPINFEMKENKAVKCEFEQLSLDLD